MAITPGAQRVDLNGVTPVTIVSAPGAGVYRTIIGVWVYNADSTVVTITLQKVISGTAKILAKVTGLIVGDTWIPINRDQVVNLVATTESLQLVMSGAPATVQPMAHADFIDKS